MKLLARVAQAVSVVSLLLALVACYRAFGWRGGDVGTWLSGLGAVAAALAALWIAQRDRADRAVERHSEQKTRARLILVRVEAVNISDASITLEARNFGPLPVLDVDFVGAEWTGHPEARWIPMKSHWVGVGSRQASITHRPILMPVKDLEDTYDTLAYFKFTFWDPTEDRPVAAIEERTAKYQYPTHVAPDLSTVVARIRFTTVDGIRWEVPTVGTAAGEPVRLPSP